MNENNELSPAKVMLTTGIIAGAVSLSAAAISATYPVSAAGVFALALAAGTLAAGLLYYLVIAPIAKRPAPTAQGEELALLATIDPITRTLNRRGITSTLLETMAQAQRYSVPLSVAIIGIDQYPRLREKRGTVDSVLQAVSQTITEVLRLPDRVGRQTDDEFLVVMPQTKIAAAAKVAERIRAAIEAGSAGPEHGMALTVSVGVAEFNKDQDLEKFLSNAQSALMQASTEGNQVMRYAARARKSDKRP